jgi:hypothetical protein
MSLYMHIFSDEDEHSFLHRQVGNLKKIFQLLARLFFIRVDYVRDDYIHVESAASWFASTPPCLGSCRLRFIMLGGSSSRTQHCSRA